MGGSSLWREAARQWRYHRAAGTGAGTFTFAHYRFRHGGGVVKHAHSQWFNVLSELGVVGLVLLAVAMVLFVVAAVGNPFSRRRDPLHPLLVALQAGVIAFIVHMSWDWDWDMAAIGTLVFVFVAVCVSYRATRAADERRTARRPARDEPAAGGERASATADARTCRSRVRASRRRRWPAARKPVPRAVAVRPRSRRVGWPVRVVASTALVLLAVSWLPPYLALRAENAALAASSDGDVAVALDRARRAATLDPLAVSPLLDRGVAAAAARTQSGGARAAAGRGEAAAAELRGLVRARRPAARDARARQGGQGRPDARPRPQSRRTPRSRYELELLAR